MKILPAATVLFLALLTQTGAAERVRVFEGGDKGTFEFPLTYEPGSFGVYNPIDPARPDSSGQYALVFGVITPQTVVRVVNRTVSRRNLDLLSGRQVLAWGKFKDVGEGEAIERYCLSLNIFVLPEKTRK